MYVAICVEDNIVQSIQPYDTEDEAIEFCVEMAVERGELEYAYRADIRQELQDTTNYIAFAEKYRWKMVFSVRKIEINK